MVRYPIIASGLAVALVALSPAPAAAQEYKARLNGFFEIGALNSNTGAILTNGTGNYIVEIQSPRVWRLGGRFTF